MLNIDRADYTLLLRQNRQMTAVNLADLKKNPVTLEVGETPGVITIRVGAGLPGVAAWTFAANPDVRDPNTYRADEGLIRLVREVFGGLAVLTLPEAVRDQAVLLTAVNGGAALVLDPRELFMFGQSVTLTTNVHGQTVVLVGTEYGKSQVALTLENDAGLAARPETYRTDAGAQLLLKRLVALKATDLRAAPAFSRTATR